jgi:hypothetical protein
MNTLRFMKGMSVFVIALGRVGMPSNAQADVPPDCTAGGPGTTYCSVDDANGSCSVDCDPGYYSCCKLDPGHCWCV